MTETAHDWLAMIAQTANLGAGMEVAMKDLEIRGVGSILGAVSAGQILESTCYPGFVCWRVGDRVQDGGWKAAARR